MKVATDRKINLTKRLLDVQDNDVLNKIEAILAETEIVAYTTKGKPLTKSQYIKHIEKISKSVSAGAKTYTSNEIKKHILNR